MDPPRIKAIIDWAASARIREVSWTCEGESVRLVKAAGVPAAAGPAAPIERAAPVLLDATGGIVTAPLYGVLHLTPAPGEAPFVSLGDRVTKGQTLASIEAMKIFNAVEADRDGTLAEILAPGGGEVERGQPLFRIA